MHVAKPVLLLRSREIMSHLEHALHELNIMLDPVFNGLKSTLLGPAASIAGFLNQGGFRADVPPSALRSDPELQSSLDVLAQEVLRLRNTCTSEMLATQVGQMRHCGLGQHGVAPQFR